MAIRKNNKTKRICPLLDKDCLKDGCEIHHAEFDRCIFDLIAYNLYALVTELKKLPKRDD